MITVYITKQAHYKFNYLVNWNNPETGATMGDWFTDEKEIYEFTKHWICRYVKVNY